MHPHPISWYICGSPLCAVHDDDDNDDGDDDDGDDPDDDHSDDDDGDGHDVDDALILAVPPEILFIHSKVNLGFPRDIAAEGLLDTEAREADAARVKAEDKLNRLLDHRRRLLNVLKASPV